MSYDIDIFVGHPDGYISHFEVGNMTYNVSGMMLEACGVTFRWMHKMPAETALPILAHAWKTMKRNPDHFRRFEVTEWGSYNDFMPFLTRFYVMARMHPTGIISVT